MDLGNAGVFTTYHAIGEENAGEAARLAESLGYGVFWLGGSPRLSSIRPLLEATQALVVATSIVNVWANDPVEVAAEYGSLERDFPDRLLVGIGIGHPEAAPDYSRPLSAMREFLDGLDRADSPVPSDRRCLAALAPKMLALSAERSLGAIPYFAPVAHTHAARLLLGPGPLLAPEVGFVLDSDVGSARRKARAFARPYLGRANYRNNFLRHGFDDEDVAGDGSDRLIDTVIPHGSAEEIGIVVREHLRAGANHIVLQAIGESGIPRQGWAALAELMSV